MAELFWNAGRYKLAAPMTAYDDEITLDGYEGVPLPTNGDTLRLVLEGDNKIEVVLVGNYDYDNANSQVITRLIDVTRGAEGTTAQDWPAGTVIGNRWTAEHATEVVRNLRVLATEPLDSIQKEGKYYFKRDASFPAGVGLNTYDQTVYLDVTHQYIPQYGTTIVTQRLTSPAGQLDLVRTGGIYQGSPTVHSWQEWRDVLGGFDQRLVTTTQNLPIPEKYWGGPFTFYVEAVGGGGGGGGASVANTNGGGGGAGEIFSGFISIPSLVKIAADRGETLTSAHLAITIGSGGVGGVGNTSGGGNGGYTTIVLLVNGVAVGSGGGGGGDDGDDEAILIELAGGGGGGAGSSTAAARAGKRGANGGGDGAATSTQYGGPGGSHKKQPVASSPTGIGTAGGNGTAPTAAADFLHTYGYFGRSIRLSTRYAGVYTATLGASGDGGQRVTRADRGLHEFGAGGHGQGNTSTAVTKTGVPGTQGCVILYFPR